MPPRTVKPLTSSPSPSSSANASVETSSEVTQDINLRVLRRDDDAIERIVAQSKHAVLYRFDTAARCWARENVEGALFVVRRTREPRYGFVVLNRCGSENFAQAIGMDGFEVERSTPYLMYKIKEDVHGIWFHDENECESMCKVFEELNAASGRAEERGTTNASQKNGLEALFARASSMTSEQDHLTSTLLTNAGAQASAPPAIRVLQAPRNIVGTAPIKSTKAPSAVAPAKSPSTTALSQAAIKAALIDLANDDAFTERIARAIAKHT